MAHILAFGDGRCQPKNTESDISESVSGLAPMNIYGGESLASCPGKCATHEAAPVVGKSL